MVDDEWAGNAREMLELDPYDERAHELLVLALTEDGRLGEAQSAAEQYRACMAELGVEPQELLSLQPPSTAGS